MTPEQWLNDVGESVVNDMFVGTGAPGAASLAIIAKIQQDARSNQPMSTFFKTTDPIQGTERHDWLMRTKKHIAEQFEFKFTRGQEEHKGDIGAVPMTRLLSEMEDEALDQLAYIQEIRRRLVGLQQ